jgi:hypothetical protein
MEGTRKYWDDPGCLRKSGGFHNSYIHIALRGGQGVLFEADSNLVKEVDL